MTLSPDHVELPGLNTSMTINRPGPSVVVVAITGADVGELGDAPFEELERQLGCGPISLFIDARKTRGASIDVSNLWARWLRKHRDRLVRVHMLAASRYVRITADFVRRFAELGDTMLIYANPDVFDETLESALQAP